MTKTHTEASSWDCALLAAHSTMQLMEAVSGTLSMLMLKCPQWRESSLSLLSEDTCSLLE